MKRFICLLLISMVCFGLAACSSAKKQEEASSAADPNAPAVETAPPATADPSGKYATLQDYVGTPQVQKDINKGLDKSDSKLNMSVYAEGDVLVYDYQYTQHVAQDALPAAGETLNKALEEQASDFTNVLTEVRNHVNVENPSVKVIYRNDDGTVITEKSFQ